MNDQDNTSCLTSLLTLVAALALPVLAVFLGTRFYAGAMVFQDSTAGLTSVLCVLMIILPYFWHSRRGWGVGLIFTVCAVLFLIAPSMHASQYGTVPLSEIGPVLGLLLRDMIAMPETASSLLGLAALHLAAWYTARRGRALGIE